MATETARPNKEASVVTRDADEFSTLLKQSFKPRTERAATEVENAVKTLVDQALVDSSVIKTDVLDTIEEMIAQLDKKLSAQINEVLHAPEFQQIEGAWRGLAYLIFQSETDAMLKIRVMDVSKSELYRHLRQFPNAAWDQSAMFKKVYEEEFGQLGGQPYGCLIGDYAFSHLPTDVQLLRDISKLFDTPEYAAWKSLRDSDDARYIGLCMPRVLARLPYGAKSEPVAEFAFEEDTDGHKGEKYAWMNAAYAMATNINRAFKEWGWCARIRGVQSGGEVEDLPAHTFPTDDGGVDLKCPTEIAITDRREAELSKAGLIPLVHRKNTDRAAFIGAQSLFKPRAYQNNPAATASSNLASRLPYMFACCRFAHYLKVMVRDKVGSYYEKEQLQKWLTNWISEYVDADPKNSSEATKCRRPLAGAQISIVENEENPGYYSALFELRPHFQLEGMEIGLRLVSKLPVANK